MPVEGTWRAHQVPLAERARATPSTSQLLEAWMRSYRPEELFDDARRAAPGARRAGARAATRRMSANPHANGGAAAARPASCPTSATTRSRCPRPATTCSEADARARRLPARRDARATRDNFRLFGPDETASNRLDAVFEATDRAWVAERLPADDHLAPDGRVMEVLSEHLCQGWLEGYLLTGRHGLFNCYEAFIHIVDSMFNQHAKWLKVTREHPVAAADRVAQLPAHARTSGARTTTASPTRTRASSTTWSTRRPRSSASTCRPTPTRCCRSPTTACAAATTSTSSWPASSRRSTTCRWTRPIAHCTRGLGIWDWASNDDGGEPDVVLACAGDVPTLETLAAAALLREHLPDLQGARRQRRRPDAPAARERAPARAVRPRVRRAVHARPRRSSSPTTATRG